MKQQEVITIFTNIPDEVKKNHAAVSTYPELDKFFEKGMYKKHRTNLFSRWTMYNNICVKILQLIVPYIAKVKTNQTIKY